MNLKKLLATIALLIAVPVLQADELSDPYVKLFKMQVTMAKNGKPGDLYNLGRMYEQGLGTEQDLDKARELYAKAAKKGEPRAVHKLEVWEQAEKELKNSLAREPKSEPEQASPKNSVKKHLAKKLSPEERKKLAFKRAMAAALKRSETSDLGW